ncbi:hypothetical protein TRVA0_020S02652 [Trichomonascus vanleenenianus]|uniref:Zn(II)2Cys6 transcription factor n=1 Tax=Trichomonascus vanleenenianus TaxID=2268995 RepID=UPI003ECA325F
MQSEEASSKRQRVSQACDWCRKKKIRCDGSKPTCTTCRNAGFNCVYTVTARKPRTVKKKASVNDLEHRLERLESLLQSIVPVIKGKKRKLQEEEEESESEESEASEASGSESEGEYDTIDQTQVPEEVQTQFEHSMHPEDESDACLQDENIPVSSHFIKIRPGLASRFSGRKKDMFQATLEKDVEHFFSNSSVLSIFSSSGMQWVTSKTGDKGIGPRLTKILTEIHHSHQTRMRQYIENDERPEMPEQRFVDFAIGQLREASMFKELLSESELRPILDSFYGRSETPCGYSEMFFLFCVVCFSLVMAIHVPEQREKLGLSFKQVHDAQDRHYKAALYYFSKVFLLGSSLLAIKAMILLIVSLQFADTKRRFDPLEIIAPVAIRFAYDLGLHRDESCAGLSEAEAQSRRIVWWFIYSLDRDVAMKVGKTPTILDFDISMKLPELDSVAVYGPLATLMTPNFDFFASTVRLYRISGLVYEKLFSAQGCKKSPAEIVRDICFLDGELAKWLDDLPPNFRPGADISSECANNKALFGHSPRTWYLKCSYLHVQYVYNHLLSTIHRITAYHPSWIYSTLSGENSHNGSPLAATKTDEFPLPESSSSSSANGGGPEEENNNTTATSTNEKRRGAAKSSPSTAGIAQQTNGVTTGTASNTPAHTPISVNSLKLRGMYTSSKYARLFTSMDICVQSARSTVELARMTREWDQSYWWGSLYFLFNSFITLFIKCIARPKDMSTQYDLDLLHMVMEQFEEVGKSVTDEEGGRLAHLLADFWECLYTAGVNYVESQSNNSGRSPVNGSLSKSRKKPAMKKAASQGEDSINGPMMPPPANPHEHSSMPQSTVYMSNAVPHATQGYGVPMENGQLHQQQQQQPQPPSHQQQQRAPEVQNYNGAPFDMGFNGNIADANVAQSLYNMSNIFFSWDSDFVWNALDFPLANASVTYNNQNSNGDQQS